MRRAFVDCWGGGKIIATYDFGLPQAILPGKSPDNAELIEEARSQLTNDRLAFPPYDGITFKVRYSN